VKLRNGPQWQRIVTLFNARNVSPISPWPGGRSAWEVDGLSELMTQMEEKKKKKGKKPQGACWGDAG
jgi:hypothetical protein